MKEIFIKNEIHNLSITVFGKSEDVILIIASATGVKQTFYRKFAEYIASNNKTVITFDYTGIGKSIGSEIKNLKVSAQQWGSADLESVLQYVLKNYPRAKTTVLGHSIGGQIIGLAPSSTKIDKLILVASQSGYWKYWKGLGRVKMWFNWHLLFPIFVYIFGYMPSKKISGMENLPKNVAKQWSSWGRHKEYLFSDIGFEETVYNKITTELTAISIADDNFAPKKAVDWMISQYRKAIVKRIYFDPKDIGTSKIGHFGVFKAKFKTNLWPILLKELA